MPQPGGAANINGILYQILGTLEWASCIQLRDASQEREEITQAQLIIEPSGGGGDARLLISKQRLVGQWKTKSNRGPWSLQQVISEVIPDLYRAVDEHRLEDDSEYLFITEGRRGKWEPAYNFFESLSGGMPPLVPLDFLDGTEKYRFFPQGSCSQKDLFVKITTIIRGHPQWYNEPEQVTHRKLWHLLARFDIKEQLTGEELRKQINIYLKGVVDYQEDVDAKRRELCGLLLDLVAQGEVNIAPGELFRRVELSETAVQNWSALKSNLTDELDHQLQVQKYDRDKDVRTAPEWPIHLPVLLLAGESGQGKTWQLFNLARKASENEGLGVLVTGQSDAERILQKAADIVWQTGLDHDQTLSLDRIARRIRKLVPTAPNPWLTVCVDDVQSSIEARRLIEQDWESWGIRLAMTIPPIPGHALQAQYPERIHFVEVADFTPNELRTYLQRHGRAWGTIQTDVRETLKRPLLASIYCKISANLDWEPKNEYEVFESYWSRIRDAPGQSEFPGDIVRLQQLAAQILRPGNTYPWTPTIVTETGVDNATLIRLESIGWLRRLADDRVEIWHDRLLNWAVAEHLVEQRQAGRIDTQALGVWLARFHSVDEKFAGKSLGYVPMDVLWLVSHPKRDLIGDVPPNLIAALEGHTTSGYLDSLYRHLLPTLGKRVLPALIARLRATAGQEFSHHGQLVADALMRIGRKALEPVKACAAELLNDSLQELQETGMRVLARTPSVAALDRLWELHKLHTQRLFEQQDRKEKDAEAYFLHDLSFAALRACSQLQPQWLVEKIHAANAQHDPVSELAYLLANLETFAARALWIQVKSILFDKVSPEKPRSLIRCIHRFRDSEEIARLEQWLTDERDLACAFALAALAVLDPDRALAHLNDVPRWALHFSKNWWLPELMISRRTQLQAKLLSFMQAPGANVWETACCYQGYENEMDASTLDFLLDTLEREIPVHFDEEKGEITPRLLKLLGSLSRVELLEKFHAKAHSRLESLLTTVACSRLGRTGRSFDLDLHNIRLLLLKIGGSGFTTLINKELEHPDFYVRLDGLAWAPAKPDNTTRQLLRSITESNRLTGTPPGPYEQLLATRALAALHEDEAVINSVFRWGLHTPADLSEWWEGSSPISNERLQAAIAALGSEESTARTNAVLVVGMSGQQDLAPRVRQILSDAPTGSELARAAVIALGDLADTDLETIRLLKEQLEAPEQRIPAMNALFRIGAKEALDALEHYFLKIGPNVLSFRDVGLGVIATLGQDLTRRQRMSNLLWTTMKSLPLSLWPNECIEMVGYVDNSTAQEWLREQAFPPEGSLSDAGQLVFIIRGLAKFDPEAAFQAAQFALQRIQGGKEGIPRLLLDLDMGGAISVLCDHTPKERHTLTRWAIGRALRHVKKSDLVREHIEEMLQSPNSEVRQTGAELCGWQDNDALQTLLFNLCTEDINDKVRGAAREALLRQRDLNEVRQLFAVFRAANSDKRWSILEAIIELGDPDLLGNKDDSLGLAQILDNAEIALIKHAEKRLEERVKEIQEEAKRIDREMERAG